jgi:hypothetical protein
MDHGNSQPANSSQLNKPFAVTQARGILSRDPDRSSRPSHPFSQHSQQRQPPSNVSGPLGDIRLTTSSSYHDEPKPEAYMREREFALAIATDYITAWSKFAQAGIAHYLRAIEINAPSRGHQVPLDPREAQVPGADAAAAV